MNEKMRTFVMKDKRRGVRLDASTWEAVDLIAKVLDKKWSALACLWAESAPTDADENLTAVIRSAAMKGMLALQRGNNLSEATAAATTTPGIICIDWRNDAASGNFQLDVKAAGNLARTLGAAMLTAAADELEASGESEQDREDRRSDEHRARRRLDREAQAESADAIANRD